jgi:DNA-binding IclR family transcriptional regulator
MAIDQDAPDFVTSLARGLAVIRSFDKDAPSMTLAEVAERTSLSRPTARRFLLTLESLGYVLSDGKRFWLAPRTLDLGYAYLSSLRIWDVAQPSMRAVVDELNESCSMGVLDGAEILYIARVPPKHLMGLQVNPGTRLPAHCTSIGRVLLAELDADAPHPARREGGGLRADRPGGRGGAARDRRPRARARRARDRRAQRRRAYRPAHQDRDGATRAAATAPLRARDRGHPAALRPPAARDRSPAAALVSRRRREKPLAAAASTDADHWPST